jgi:hypothetical protein
MNTVCKQKCKQEHVELARVGDGVSQLKQVAVDMNEV